MCHTVICKAHNVDVTQYKVWDTKICDKTIVFIVDAVLLIGMLYEADQRKGEMHMNHDEVIAGLIQEFRRGTLIMLVLSQLKEPMYGYNLVKVLEDADISIEGNTLYPLMRRLEGQGLLKSEWETDGAKPRKYYVITEDGIIVLEKITQHWRKFSESIEKLLEA